MSNYSVYLKRTGLPVTHERQLSVMESSTDNMNENEGAANGAGAEMVAAMAGIVDKLQQVAV